MSSCGSCCEGRDQISKRGTRALRLNSGRFRASGLGGDPANSAVVCRVCKTTRPVTELS